MVYKSEQNECREWLWRADGGHGISASESCTLVLRLARARNLVRAPQHMDEPKRPCMDDEVAVRGRRGCCA
eukprot:6195821-Pleurochrysis_carterae.AAC.1